MGAIRGPQGGYRVVGHPGPGLARVTTVQGERLLFSQVRRVNNWRAKRGSARAETSCAVCGKELPPGERYYRYPIGGSEHAAKRICERCGTGVDGR